MAIQHTGSRFCQAEHWLAVERDRSKDDHCNDTAAADLKHIEYASARHVFKGRWQDQSSHVNEQDDKPNLCRFWCDFLFDLRDRFFRHDELGSINAQDKACDQNHDGEHDDRRYASDSDEWSGSKIGTGGVDEVTDEHHSRCMEWQGEHAGKVGSSDHHDHKGNERIALFKIAFFSDLGNIPQRSMMPSDGCAKDTEDVRTKDKSGRQGPKGSF